MLIMLLACQRSSQPLTKKKLRQHVLKPVGAFLDAIETGEEGFEPPTPWSVATCSSPLSYTPLQELNSNTVYDAKIAIFYDSAQKDLETPDPPQCTGGSPHG